MKTLYKFVREQTAVLAMAGGSLKFTETEKLNDPPELVSFMNREAVRDSLAALRENGYTDEQFEWLGFQEAILRLLSPETILLSRPATKELATAFVRSPIFDDMDYMEAQLRRTITSIRSAVCILSLTERFDSLPMWVHYGALGEGYVVCFDELDRVFPGDDTGSLNAL